MCHTTLIAADLQLGPKPLPNTIQVDFARLFLIIEATFFIKSNSGNITGHHCPWQLLISDLIVVLQGNCPVPSSKDPLSSRALEKLKSILCNE
mmetsp:Transcript_20828/g.28669  ORF Transcript_20828/g.28669 Transcript_20828/m.28669 type:complete len:93 (+) Transcript_20828:1820-2098(+)